jgi:alpha-ketoglutarate-dependent taurine dioxygenase
MQTPFAEALVELVNSPGLYKLYSDSSITWENFQGKLPANYCAVPSHEGEVDEIRDIGFSADYGKHSGAFTFHIDGAYYPVAPRYFTLYCVRPSLAGGYTVLADSKTVIERLYEKYDANFLESMHIMYMSRGNQVYKRHLIQAGRCGSNLKKLNWVNSCYFVPDLALLSIRNRKVYTSLLETFLKDIRQYFEEAIVFNDRLEAGQGIIVDNHRLFHSRTAFDGGDRLLYRMMIDTEGFDLNHRPQNIPH